MGKLTAAMRKKLATKTFALPGRRYPINDPNHARAALSMAHYATPPEQEVIKAKVARRFPGIGQTNK